MNQIVITFPLQNQIVLEGERRNYIFTFDEVETYLMDTRGFSKSNMAEYNIVELVEQYIDDPYEVEALAYYSNKPSSLSVIKEQER